VALQAPSAPFVSRSVSLIRLTRTSQLPVSGLEQVDREGERQRARHVDARHEDQDGFAFTRADPDAEEALLAAGLLQHADIARDGVPVIGQDSAQSITDTST